MTKQDIINYVMDTPCNTNSAVLSSLLNQLPASGGSDMITYEVITCGHDVVGDMNYFYVKMPSEITSESLKQMVETKTIKIIGQEDDHDISIYIVKNVNSNNPIIIGQPYSYSAQVYPWESAIIELDEKNSLYYASGTVSH